MNEDLLNNKRNGSEMNTEQKIMERVSQYKVPSSSTKEDALRLLKSRIAENKSRIIEIPEKKNRINLYWIATAAAGILLLFGVWHFVFNQAQINILAAKGEHINYQLPDGSVVAINAESKIAFSKNNFTKNRFLEMEGEAFFNVQKGSKFVVRTPNADIQVLGTSFNVFARQNTFKVSCVTGKIKVESGNQSLIIVPGESAVVSNNILSKFHDKNIQTVANWRNGEFYFENEPLQTVFEELGRQFNVTFELPKMEMKFFTGSFTNNNLANALDVVCIPMQLEYEIGNNSKVFIREKP
jgi:Fe2+-dicitrate sensor, membrane component